MEWDVVGGIARRSWARNLNAFETAYNWNIENEGRGHITLPFMTEDKLLDDIIDKYLKKNE